MIDWWQALFFFLAAILILFQVIRGWRLGVVRQVSRLIALAAAYAAVRWEPDLMTPFLHYLGVPKLASGVLSAVVLGITVYATINGLSAIVLKRTSQQSFAPLRIVYGLGGAVIGLLFGLFLTWIALIGVRVLGTVAETEVRATTRRAEMQEDERDAKARRQEISGLVRGLASLKQSMDQGQTGAVAEAVDPLPAKVYTTLTRIALLISDEESIDRFLAYPGARVITSHPRMVALTTDAEITEQLNQGNFFGLLRNPNIRAAASDPELAELVARFELDKALEQALVPESNSTPDGTGVDPSTRH